MSRIWTKILKLDQVAINDYFYDLGGDRCWQAKIGEQCSQQLLLPTPIQASTVAKMADILHQEKLTLGDSALGAIQPNGARPPFFWVPGIGGQALGFTALSHKLSQDQPFYGLGTPGRDGEQPSLNRIEDITALFVSEIRDSQPRGPYFLGFFSWGGQVIFEMAQQLRSNGEKLALSACSIPFARCPSALSISAGNKHGEFSERYKE